MKLSIFDFSNAWDINYPTTPEDLATIMDSLQPIAEPRSLFLITAERWVWAGTNPTFYSAFRFQTIAHDFGQKLALGRLIEASERITRILHGGGYPKAEPGYEAGIKRQALLDLAILSLPLKPKSLLPSFINTIDFGSPSCADRLTGGPALPTK